MKKKERTLKKNNDISLNATIFLRKHYIFVKRLFEQVVEIAKIAISFPTTFRMALRQNPCYSDDHISNSI